MPTEKKRQSQLKWDKDNMRSVSCRLRTSEAELFKEYCAANKTTPGAVLKNYVHKLLDEYCENKEK